MALTCPSLSALAFITDISLQTEGKLDNIEARLNPNVKGLLDDIEALKNKTEMNRAQAEEAKAQADDALKNATDVKEVWSPLDTELLHLMSPSHSQGVWQSVSSFAS